MQINLSLNFQDLLEIQLPEIIDNENDKVFLNFNKLPNFIEFDSKNLKLLIN
jgi:hypothetical protein